MTTLTADQVKRIAEATAKWDATTNQVQRDAAHAEAEAVRAESGFSGGAWGNQVIPGAVVSAAEQAQLYATEARMAAPPVGQTPPMDAPSPQTLMAAPPAGQTPRMAAPPAPKLLAAPAPQTFMDAPPVDQTPPMTAPAAQAPMVYTPTQNNAQMINTAYDSYLQSQLAGIQGARDQANSDYQGQIDKAPETYAPQRQKVDTQTARNVQSLNQTAAAKGTAFTGGVASDQSQVQNVGGQQKTALTQQEINFVQNLKKAIADTTKAAGFQEVAATGQSKMAQNQALLNENIRVDDTNYNRNMATQTFNANQQSIHFQQGMDVASYNAGRFDAAFNKNMDVASYNAGRADASFNQSMAVETFNANQQNTAFQQGMDVESFNAGRSDAAFNQNMDVTSFSAGRSDAAFNQNMSTQSFNANQQNTQFNQNMDTQTFEANKQNTQFTQDMATKTFALDTQQVESQLKTASLAQAGQMITNEMNQISLDIQKDPNSPENLARGIALQTAQVQLKDALTNSKYTEAEAKGRVAATLASIRASDASASASRTSSAASMMNARTNQAQFAWSKDPSNPDNIKNVSANDAAIMKQNKELYDDTYDRAWNMMQAAKTGIDPATGATVDKSTYNMIQVGNLIDASALEDSAAYLMRRQLGVPEPK